MTKKAQFEQWLLNLNEDGLNQLGIQEILSCLNDDLEIIKGNELEQFILKELLDMFG